MTRQEKINKASRFCANNDCGRCTAHEICFCAGGPGTRPSWGIASEPLLDRMIAEIDKADKPATPPANDPVNHPSHYTTGGIECIDALNSMMQGYKTADTGALAWQIVKYVWRAPLEGNMAQDLGKAKFYLDRLISKTEGGA